MNAIIEFFNGNCFWSCDFDKWGEPFERGYKRYNDNTEYVRNYQRRTCKSCGSIEERRIGD